MARKSRSRKRKPKNQPRIAKPPHPEVVLPVAEESVPEQSEVVMPPLSEHEELVETDVVLPRDSRDRPTMRATIPIIHSAEVIEIRCVDDDATPEEPSELADEEPLSLGEWDEPEFQELPKRPAAEEVPAEPQAPEETLAELEALQSELDQLLASGEVIEETPVNEAPVSEATRKPIHRLERKLRRPGQLPEELLPAEPPRKPLDLGNPLVGNAGPEREGEGSSWGQTKVGGPGEDEKFFGKSNLLRVVEEIPLIGRMLVRDGAWRPQVIFIAFFIPINALVFALVLSLISGNKDGLRSVNEGETPVAAVISVPTEEIAEVVRAYATAPTWEEKLKYVRAAGHVVEKLRDYYATHPINPAKDVLIERAQQVEVNGLDLFKVEATLLPQSETFTAMIERDPRGYLKIDWEVAIDYQEMDWKAFYDQQITTPTEMRVVCRLSQGLPHHNFQFADTTRYRCYELQYPNSELPRLLGFTEIDSELDKELMLLLSSATDGKQALILSLAYPENAQDPAMVFIRELICPAWVIDYEAASSLRGKR